MSEFNQYAGQSVEFNTGRRAARVRLGEMLDENIGVEGRKFPLVDVRPLQLGFDTGFVLIGSEAVVDKRYRNWSGMRADGLGKYLTQHCVRAQLAGSDGVAAHSLISEDLTAEGWEIFEFNAFGRKGIMPGNAGRGANRYVFDYINSLNSSANIHEAISRIGSRQVRDTFSWFADVYLKQFKQPKLPHLDPFVEKNFQELQAVMKKSGWTARTESVFLMTRTRQDRRSEWPYERKVIVGDVGEGVYKGGEGGLDRKHLDVLYSIMGIYYSA